MFISLLNLFDFRTTLGIYPLVDEECIRSRLINFYKFYLIFFILIPLAFLAGFYLFTPFGLIAVTTEILKTIGTNGIFGFYLLLFLLVEALFNMKGSSFVLGLIMIIASPRLLRKERRRRRLQELRDEFYCFLYGIIRISLKMILIIIILNAMK